MQLPPSLYMKETVLLGRLNAQVLVNFVFGPIVLCRQMWFGPTRVEGSLLTTDWRGRDGRPVR